MPDRFHLVRLAATASEKARLKEAPDLGPVDLR